MKITMTATEKITQLDGVPVRVWEGVTEAGTKCICFVHRIAVHNSEDSGQFERELAEQLPPGISISMRNIL